MGPTWRLLAINSGSLVDLTAVFQFLKAGDGGELLSTAR
jgi:hypothetical protein